MKKYIFILGFVLCMSAGLAISQENRGEKPAQQSEPVTEQTKPEKECKKVCVQRDGYGMCTEFEERCKEN